MSKYRRCTMINIHTAFSTIFRRKNVYWRIQCYCSSIVINQLFIYSFYLLHGSGDGEELSQYFDNKHTPHRVHMTSTHDVVVSHCYLKMFNILAHQQCNHTFKCLYFSPCVFFFIHFFRRSRKCKRKLLIKSEHFCLI